MVKLICFDNNPPEILAGQAVAQCVLMSTPRTNFMQVDELSETLRGDNGFGSTDKGEQMTTKEAISYMLEGKKLTSNRWSKEEFIYFDGECFREEDGYPISLSDISEVRESLKIYEEPKPKQVVLIEKWLLKMQGTEQYAIEEGSKEEMNTWGKYKTDAWQKVKLLDTYEVKL